MRDGVDDELWIIGDSGEPSWRVRGGEPSRLERAIELGVEPRLETRHREVGAVVVRLRQFPESLGQDHADFVEAAGVGENELGDEVADVVLRGTDPPVTAR